VETDEPDDVASYDPPDEVSRQIAEHIVAFLRQEMAARRIPEEFLPVQAGGGSLVNAVLAHLGAADRLPPFHVYGDVFPDSLLELLEAGHVRGASATSLTLSASVLRRLFSNMDYFSPRVVLRPQEISNNRSILQRLGIVAINRVVEVDLCGCVNATRRHNGHPPVGGSGDFVRNAYLSFLVTPSAPDDGRISAIVPMVRHVDYSEYGPQIVVTEQGLADLRGFDGVERAEALISQCAHPRYRDYLYRYLEGTPLERSPHDVERSFELQRNLIAHGSMLPMGVDA
jgi:acetyl-CoA hydrolase